MVTGGHGFVSPWIVPTPIEYEKMRYLSDNVQCSNGCSNFLLLLNIHNQTGARGEPERLRKESLFPKGRTTERKLFLTPLTTRSDLSLFFAKGFEGRSYRNLSSLKSENSSSQGKISPKERRENAHKQGDVIEKRLSELQLFHCSCKQPHLIKVVPRTGIESNGSVSLLVRSFFAWSTDQSAGG